MLEAITGSCSCIIRWSKASISPNSCYRALHVRRWGIYSASHKVYIVSLKSDWSNIVIASACALACMRYLLVIKCGYTCRYKKSFFLLQYGTPRIKPTPLALVNHTLYFSTLALQVRRMGLSLWMLSQHYNWSRYMHIVVKVIYRVVLNLLWLILSQ